MGYHMQTAFVENNGIGLDNTQAVKDLLVVPASPETGTLGEITSIATSDRETLERLGDEVLLTFTATLEHNALSDGDLADAHANSKNLVKTLRDAESTLKEALKNNLASKMNSDD